MKFNCRMTEVEKVAIRKQKNRARYDRLSAWRPVFLWFRPRRMVDNAGNETRDCRYMEKVLKRNVVGAWYFDTTGRIDVIGTEYKAFES